MCLDAIDEKTLVKDENDETVTFLRPYASYEIGKWYETTDKKLKKANISCPLDFHVFIDKAE